MRLARSRSTLEWLNVLLGGVRMWLTGIAVAFYLLATGLRILGNGLSALGGLVAFTVSARRRLAWGRPYQASRAPERRWLAALTRDRHVGVRVQVVFSIAISVLSAATFLAASAADGTGTALEYMARCAPSRCAPPL